MKPQRKFTCCICKKETIGYGNNAQPIMQGECCDTCNENVITERIRRLELNLQGGI